MSDFGTTIKLNTIAKSPVIFAVGKDVSGLYMVLKIKENQKSILSEISICLIVLMTFLFQANSIKLKNFMSPWTKRLRPQIEVIWMHSLPALHIITSLVLITQPMPVLPWTLFKGRS